MFNFLWAIYISTTGSVTLSFKLLTCLFHTLLFFASSFQSITPRLLRPNLTTSTNHFVLGRPRPPFFSLSIKQDSLNPSVFSYPCYVAQPFSSLRFLYLHYTRSFELLFQFYICSSSKFVTCLNFSINSSQAFSLPNFEFIFFIFDERN